MPANHMPSTPGRILDLWRPPTVSLKSSFHVWERNAVRFKKGWLQYILPNFLEPIMYLMAIGLGVGLYVGEQIMGVEYVTFIAPGLAASSAMYGAVFELTWNTWFKMKVERSYDAVVATPVEPEDVALGQLLWGATRSGLYGAAFMLVVALLGHVQSWWALLSPLALPLVGLSMGAIALTVAIVNPVSEYFTYFFNVFIVPLFLFSGIFFPITDLPPAAQTIAWFTPLHHGVEMNRALVLTGDIASAGQHALWLIVFTLVLLPVPLNLMRRKLIA